MGMGERQSLKRAGGRQPLDGWQGLLAEGSPHAVLEKIRENDLLDLFPTCAARIRDRAVLVDSERVFDLCLARIAVNSQSLGSPPDLDWLVEQVDGAVDHALRQDQRLDRSGAVPEEDDPNYHFMVLALAMHPTLTCSAVVAFNALPQLDRDRFFALFDGNNIDQCTTLGLGSREEVGQSMRDCLRALKYLDETVSFGKGAGP